ncbi:hypothetical protein T492DRAFT_1011807 [Pavlovales sp. CCMP2436]|nr:hypothetical protein T492DRAFT_1011807 [Pavlovales sp. CCMP2436]|mmetsp:Transcript_49849/g.116742  ORF Transcript_49849/g.116742 Transcript_49849/m.116742 type:complete len:307 (-) Transcript_49849:367-1287(-)
MTNQECCQVAIAQSPDQSRAITLQDVAEALAQCAASAASARALMATLTQGLYVLLNRNNEWSGSMTGDGEVQAAACDWCVKRFVLASPRGDLVFFSATIRQDGKRWEDGCSSRWWELSATVIGVADEPQLAEIMRGSLGLRAPQLLAWFDGLFLGGDPHLLKDPKALAPPPGCGKLLRLVDCWVAVSGGSLYRQCIKPPPSPAAVASLLDSLGLGEEAVHPNDLLLALLFISDMVPADRMGEVWGSPPDEIWWEPDKKSNPREHAGLCLWSSCILANADSESDDEFADQDLEWDGAPTRMTWAARQ